MTIKHSLLAATLALSGLAMAQDNYPSKAITLTVPNPPGGVVDTSARLLNEPLARVIGQPVVIDNKAGGSGNVAYGAVARAKPDGYNLLISYSAYHVGNPALTPSLPWEAKDFAPVALLTVATNVIAAHPSVPASNLKEFIAYLKANPGKVNYASQGNGSLSHIGTEIFKQQSGTFMTHIPYRGAAPAMQDVMGGQVPCMFLDLAAGLPVIQSGKVRALAIGSAQRATQLPNVPTLAEGGVKNSEVFAFQGILAPAGLPSATTGRLNAELNKALDSEAVKKRMADFSMEALPGTPDQFRAFARAESKRWGEIIRTVGIKLD